MGAPGSAGKPKALSEDGGWDVAADDAPGGEVGMSPKAGIQEPARKSGGDLAAVRLYLRDASRKHRLTAREERRCCRFIRKGPNENAQAEGPEKRLGDTCEGGCCLLIEGNLRLVVSIARRYQGMGAAARGPHPGGEPGADGRGAPVRSGADPTLFALRGGMDPGGNLPGAFAEDPNDPDSARPVGAPAPGGQRGSERRTAIPQRRVPHGMASASHDGRRRPRDRRGPGGAARHHPAGAGRGIARRSRHARRAPHVEPAGRPGVTRPVRRSCPVGGAATGPRGRLPSSAAVAAHHEPPLRTRGLRRSEPGGHRSRTPHLGRASTPVAATRDGDGYTRAPGSAAVLQSGTRGARRSRDHPGSLKPEGAACPNRRRPPRATRRCSLSAGGG